MKKITTIIAVASTMVLTGCLKDSPNTDFSKTGATVEILYSGLEYFSNSSPQNQSYAINFTSDTLTYDVIVNMNSDYPLNTDTKVSLAVDANALAAYNANSPIQYAAMPSACYSFPVTSGTIAAGTRQVHFALSFFKSIFDSLTDPAQSYMVPITLTNSSGVTVASNFATIYPHTIGNPIAGAYFWDWERWSTTDSTSQPLYGGSFFRQPTVLVPDDPNTVEVRSGYYIQPHYVITFSGSGAKSSLSNFSVAFNAADLTTMNNAGVTFPVLPTFIKADPVNNYYQIYYIAFNGSAYRFIVDTYYK